MKKHEIYKCADSPLTVELLNAADKCCSTLVCCDAPMKLMEEKGAAAEGKEKHVPVVKDGKEGIRVEVGSVPHPMAEEHYIEWIEVINGPYVNRIYLKPGQEPAGEFYVPKQEGQIVRIYCNVHGLWRA